MLNNQQVAYASKEYITFPEKQDGCLDQLDDRLNGIISILTGHVSNSECFPTIEFCLKWSNDVVV